MQIKILLVSYPKTAKTPPRFKTKIKNFVRQHLNPVRIALPHSNHPLVNDPPPPQNFPSTLTKMC